MTGRHDASVHTPHDQPTRLLTIRSGGWVLIAAGALCLIVIAWGVAGVFIADRDRIGDGSDPATYGFNLDHARIPVAQIVAAVEHRDMIRPLDHPRTISPADADRFNEEERGKYLVTTDRVIGVVINDEARAYPLRMLDWHEIVNDTVGGAPIAVTYNGLCDSALVFDRRVGDETVEFAVSGLLYNSNLLMYDRREERGGESLWSQLQGRAVTGPHAAAGAVLNVLPAALTTWSAWRERHPDTTVLAPNPDPTLVKYYNRRTYGHYFSSDQIKFPVSPLPPEGQLKRKDRVIAVRSGDDHEFDVLPLRDIAAQADASGVWETTIDGAMMRFIVTEEPLTAMVVDADGEFVESIHAFWFAWYALREAAGKPE